MDYPFLYSMNLCKELYGVTFRNSDEFCEIALNAWDIIGNRHCRIYKYFGESDGDGMVELPCNCLIIEAVLVPKEIHDSNYSYKLWRLKAIEEWIEQRKVHTNPLYNRGHYVHYTKIGNQILIDHPNMPVCIIYKGIEIDEDELPGLNHKEANAIATYVAWISKFKNAMETNNQANLNFANLLERRWYNQCSQAHQPAELLSQNEFNEIAEAKNRFPGRRYSFSHKPIIN